MKKVKIILHLLLVTMPFAGSAVFAQVKEVDRKNIFNWIKEASALKQHGAVQYSF